MKCCLIRVLLTGLLLFPLIDISHNAWAESKATRVKLGTATKGSNQNLPFLETGKIDIGLVEGNAARKALDGIGRAPANLKVLSVMYPNPGMFVVRASSAYKTIDDLKGKSIAFGTRASGLRILVNDVLEGLSLKPDVDFQPVFLDKAADGPRLVLEKKWQRYGVCRTSTILTGLATIILAG